LDTHSSDSDSVSSNRQHPSYDGCLENKEERFYQNCSVLCCTVYTTVAHYEQIIGEL